MIFSTTGTAEAADENRGTREVLAVHTGESPEEPLTELE
jgi:hypothetical protein